MPKIATVQERIGHSADDGSPRLGGPMGLGEALVAHPGHGVVEALEAVEIVLS